jgi:uncharacterized protein (TIGR02145 family)
MIFTIKRILLKVLFLFLLSGSFLPIGESQQALDTLQDQRDGKKYEIIRIGDLWWLRDNLMYETALSYCPNYSISETDCAHGNFYPYTELDLVCPENWRIPNDTELHAYLRFRMQEQKGALSDLVIDTLQKKNLSLNYRDTSDKVNLMSDPNPLNFKMPGWVEGNKMADSRTVSFWVRHHHEKDPKFHVHLTNQNYIFHTHDSYIDDAPEKSRKLKVKCVRDAKH